MSVSVNSRFCLLAFSIVVVSIGAARQADSSSAIGTLTSNSRFVGAGSCSASACHNGVSSHGTSGSEYATWITRDPHARAYEVLFSARSQAMQKNLQRRTAAHEDGRCLRCHVAPDDDFAKPPLAAPYFKTDGVSCESCHGPARDWINHHHLDAWQHKSTAEKQRLGMNDTRSLVGRARVCATCHVGAKGMDVDHDLIAAGHPRLHFEFSAFHAHMPRHWPDARDRAKPDFEARAWVAGQLATSLAALDLLAARSSNAGAWPEFAEFDCAACHHNLQDPSPRQKLGAGQRNAGAVTWGHQVALTPIVLENIAGADKVRERLQSLQKLMDSVNPKREIVTSEANRAAAQMRELLARVDSDIAVPARDRLTNQLLAKARKLGPATDDRTQVYLGLAALHRNLPAGLASPSVQTFDPQAIQVRLRDFKNSSKGP